MILKFPVSAAARLPQWTEIPVVLVAELRARLFVILVWSIGQSRAAARSALLLPDAVTMTRNVISEPNLKNPSYRKILIITTGILTLNIIFGFDPRFTIINLLWLLV